MICLTAGISFAVNRSIYIWDAAAPGATFQHPDSTSPSIIRPRDGWIQAIQAIQADEGGDIYGMRDTLLFSYGTDWPTDLNPYSIVIISMGWIDGSGPDEIDAAKQAQIIAHLDATDRTPEGQTAVILEGNDFAKLYCDTAATHFTYAGTFADYTGTLLLLDNAGHTDVLVGEDSSFAEGMRFNYKFSAAASTSMDDIIINSAVWDEHYLRYIFNATGKCPARGIQRRSYSPGAIVTLPFQFGNISRGVYNKEQLLTRILDFCIMPLTEITTAVTSETLYTDSSFTLSFTTYDNRCVTTAVIEFSTDGGVGWHMVNQVPFPGSLEDFDFNLPHHAGSEFYLRVTVHDSVFNSTADTLGPFVLLNAAGMSEGGALPVDFSLTANPNPFNGAVTLRAYGPVASEIEIYDIYGSLVAKLPFGPKGETVLWDASAQAAGVYLSRIAGSNARAKLVFIK